ncbi:MAG: response regulator, partial [Wenzhouxiangellaceae bacterium]
MNVSGKTVFLADDHELVRAGLRTLLQEMLDMDIVGEASDGQDVVRGVCESRPDLVLLDIGMPGLNGIDVIERLRGRGESLPIIMLSMHSSVEDVARAMAAGANGYLPKESAFDELSQALDAVFSGAEYLGRSIDVEQVRRTREEIARGGSRLTLLTSRQREILQLIAEGY